MSAAMVGQGVKTWNVKTWGVMPGRGGFSWHGLQARVHGLEAHATDLHVSRSTSSHRHPHRPHDRAPQVLLLERVPAVLRELVAVESAGQVVEAGAQLFGGHVRRAEVDVEEGAALPRAVLQEPALLLELLVHRRAGERR